MSEQTRTIRVRFMITGHSSIQELEVPDSIEIDVNNSKFTEWLDEACDEWVDRHRLGWELAEDHEVDPGDEPVYSEDEPHHYFDYEDWKEDVYQGYTLNGYDAWVKNNLEQKRYELKDLEDQPSHDVHDLNEMNDIRSMLDPDFEAPLPLIDEQYEGGPGVDYDPRC